MQPASLLYAVLLACPLVIGAQDRAQANTAHQLTEYAAYLTIISQIPGNSEQLKNTYLGLADTVGSQAIALTTGREVYAARFGIAFQRMLDEEM